METFPVLAKNGKYTVAFEVENAFIGPDAAARLLSTVSGVTDVKSKGYPMFGEIRAEFIYLGKRYQISEPFGDNSRYWIGPEGGLDNAGDVANLENAFRNYEPSLFERVIGNLLMFRFRKVKNIFRKSR